MKHAVEIGAGDRYSSQLLELVKHIDHIQLIEPNMTLACDLGDAVRERGLTNVLVRGGVVGAARGSAELIHMGYASYVRGAPSFLRLGCEDDCEEYWKM